MPDNDRDRDGDSDRDRDTDDEDEVSIRNYDKIQCDVCAPGDNVKKGARARIKIDKHTHSKQRVVHSVTQILTKIFPEEQKQKKNTNTHMQRKRNVATLQEPKRIL